MSVIINGTTGIDTIQDNIVTSAKIVNGAVAFADLLGTDWTSSHGANGYQKLPSGLIIQWGAGTASAAGVTNTFPIAFTTTCYVVIGNNTNQTNPPTFSSQSVTTTNFLAIVSSGSPAIFYVAIGK